MKTAENVALTLMKGEWIVFNLALLFMALCAPLEAKHDGEKKKKKRRHMDEFQIVFVPSKGIMGRERNL